ncbi:MAG: radical SAM family heme chaperone HemW [Clostridia bacterium]
MNKDIGIYIHIPFCTSKCYYCDFVSYCNKDEYIQTYVDSLCNEILENSDILNEYNIISIYIGGGTPSYIDSKYIVKILDTLKIFVTHDISITIEVNPNSVSENKVTDYVNSGINRFSIGLQSTNNNILSCIGRKHTYEDFLNALTIINNHGITNISVDLIYPLPGLKLIDLDNSLNKVISLKDKYNIKHISIYNLEIHEGTKLDFLLKENFLSLCDEDEEYDMKEHIKSKLNENGYNRYEISNYAIDGYESEHNLNYWKQGIYLGFGVAASSFFNGTRYKNTDSIEEYIEYFLKSNHIKSIISEKEELDKLALMREYVILNLRLIEGINIMNFKQRFKVDIFDLFKKEIDKMLNKELLQVTRTNVFLTEKGKDFANIVWEEFI